MRELVYFIIPTANLENLGDEITINKLRYLDFPVLTKVNLNANSSTDIISLLHQHMLLFLRV